MGQAGKLATSAYAEAATAACTNPECCTQPRGNIQNCSCRVASSAGTYWLNMQLHCQQAAGTKHARNPDVDNRCVRKGGDCIANRPLERHTPANPEVNNRSVYNGGGRIANGPLERHTPATLMSTTAVCVCNRGEPRCWQCDLQSSRGGSH